MKCKLFLGKPSKDRDLIRFGLDKPCQVQMLLQSPADHFQILLLPCVLFFLNPVRCFCAPTQIPSPSALLPKNNLFVVFTTNVTPVALSFHRLSSSLCTIPKRLAYFDSVLSKPLQGFSRYSSLSMSSYCIHVWVYWARCHMVHCLFLRERGVYGEYNF